MLVATALPAGLLLLAAMYMLETRGIPYSQVQTAYAVAFGLIITGAASLELRASGRPGCGYST